MQPVKKMRSGAFLAGLLLAALLVGALWTEPATANHFIRGDVSQDGDVDMGDALNILGSLYLGQPIETPRCLDAADADDDGKVELSDAIRILAFLFLGGPPPPPPYPDCGTDLVFDDLICESFEPCGLPGAVVARGPQLALAGKTTMTIAWLSDKSTIGIVEYRPYGRYLGAPFRAAERTARTTHVAILKDLSPGTTYFYRILHEDKVASDGHTFATHPADPDAPLRFCAFGDSNLMDAGYGAQQAVAKSILAGRPDLVLAAGDIVSSSGPDGDYFGPFSYLLDHIPYYPTIGNHEGYDASIAAAFRATLYLPPGGGFFYYSFDRGNAHFIALNSNEDLAAGSAQYSWLAADLKKTNARWIFVFFHEGPYNTGMHGSRTDLRLGLFDTYHVDVVFNGHDHNYQRSFPLKAQAVVDQASEPDYIDPQGTVYVVTGGGGSMNYSCGKDYFTAFARSTFHHTRVDVQGSRLTLSAVLPDGTVFDRMTITKTE